MLEARALRQQVDALRPESDGQSLKALPLHDAELERLRAVCLEAHRLGQQVRQAQAETARLIEALEREATPSTTAAQRQALQLQASAGLQQAEQLLGARQTAGKACQSGLAALSF